MLPPFGKRKGSPSAYEEADNEGVSPGKRCARARRP